MKSELAFAAVLCTDKGPEEEVNEYLDVDVVFDGTGKEARNYLARMLRDARGAGASPRRLLGCESETNPRVYEVGGGAAGYSRFFLQAT